MDAGLLPARAGVPEPARMARAGRPPYAPPESTAERIVARVWADLLRVADVGRHDDFHRLGGTPLLLIGLANRLGAAAGREVAVRDLYLASTVESQARLFGQADGRIPAVWPVPRERPAPLSFGQHRLWLLDRLDPDRPGWATPLVLRLPAHLDPDVVRRALHTVAGRHEILRTRYVLDSCEPRQVVDEPSPVPLRVLDCPRGAALARHLGDELERAFDLVRGAVWRALLVRIPGEEHLLLVTVHAIAADRWSAVILAEEIRELCAALPAGREAELRALPIQYADHAVWQRRWVTDGLLDVELRYWRQELAGLVPLDLPTDRAGRAGGDPCGAAVVFGIPPDLADAVGALGRRHAATPFMTLLTGFATVLAQGGAGWDIPVGTPVTGRPRPDVSGVVGPFVSSVVLRCRLGGELTFAGALARVRQTGRMAFAHQDLPFECLVEELRPALDPRSAPLHQVMLDVHAEGATVTGHRELGPFRRPRRFPAAELNLCCYLTAGRGITGVFEYAAARFDRSTIAGLADRLVRLLAAAVRDPDAQLSTVGADMVRS